MRNMQGDNEDNNSHNKHYSMQQLCISTKQEGKQIKRREEREKR